MTTTTLSPRALARIRELSGRSRAVEFGPPGSGVPTRDPKTGAFTVGGNVTAKMLRKAWSAQPVTSARLPARPVAGSATPGAFKLGLFNALRTARLTCLLYA